MMDPSKSEKPRKIHDVQWVNQNQIKMLIIIHKVYICLYLFIHTYYTDLYSIYNTYMIVYVHMYRCGGVYTQCNYHEDLSSLPRFRCPVRAPNQLCFKLPLRGHWQSRQNRGIVPGDDLHQWTELGMGYPTQITQNDQKIIDDHRRS